MSGLLDCLGVSRSFGDQVAVRDISLSLAAGQVQALVGLNGAGKTTLMRLMLGMIRPDSGKVLIHGRTAATAPGPAWARVGHLIDSPFTYPELTVRQNLWAAARLHGVAHRAAPAAVDRVLDRLDLGQWADRRAGTLSLGNRQRVGLAAALIHRPDTVVLDEPGNALDPAGVVLLRDLVLELAASGTAVLVSSHHLDEVARVADSVAVIHRGSLIGSLDPSGVELERAFFEMAYAHDAAHGLAPAGPAAS